MKKLLILILFIGSLTASAQNFIYSTPQHHVDVFMDKNYVGYDVKFTTPQPEEITFKWKKLSNTLPDGWNMSLCDYGNCYVGIASAGTMTSISLQQSKDSVEGFFIFNISPKSYGSGIIQLYVYDSRDINRGDTVSVDITNRDFVAVPNMESKPEIQFYPNPAKTQIRFVNLGSETFTADITNQLGASVLKVDELSASNSTISITDLQAGVYFVSFRSESGVLRKQKLIIQ